MGPGPIPMLIWNSPSDKSLELQIIERSSDQAAAFGLSDSLEVQRQSSLTRPENFFTLQSILSQELFSGTGGEAKRFADIPDEEEAIDQDLIDMTAAGPPSSGDLLILRLKDNLN
jgi:hypothetical protein